MKKMEPAKKHDHVGHMMFLDRKAWCSKCGQRWWRGDGKVDPETGVKGDGTVWITTQTFDKRKKKG